MEYFRPKNAKIQTFHKIRLLDFYISFIKIYVMTGVHKEVIK